VSMEMDTTTTTRIARLIRPPRPRCASGLSWMVASEMGDGLMTSIMYNF
jgi:hypothetical protein